MAVRWCEPDDDQALLPVDQGVHDPVGSTSGDDRPRDHGAPDLLVVGTQALRHELLDREANQVVHRPGEERGGGRVGVVDGAGGVVPHGEDRIGLVVVAFGQRPGVGGAHGTKR